MPDAIGTTSHAHSIAPMLVAFSCEPRGVCCSCGARRTAHSAANLVDRVLPDVPRRQWVLSAPLDLRLTMAREATLLSAVVRIFCSEIERLFVTWRFRST